MSLEPCEGIRLPWSYLMSMARLSLVHRRAWRSFRRYANAYLIDVHLRTFACKHFRNLEHVSIEPHARFNIFEGRNGQGKTNLLEAIGLLGSFKSFRDARNSQLIQFGQSRCEITARVERKDVLREISIETEGKGKRVRIDGKTLTKRSEYLGHVSIVFFGQTTYLSQKRAHQ